MNRRAALARLSSFITQLPCFKHGLPVVTMLGSHQPLKLSLAQAALKSACWLVTAKQPANENVQGASKAAECGRTCQYDFTRHVSNPKVVWAGICASPFEATQFQQPAGYQTRQFHFQSAR